VEPWDTGDSGWQELNGLEAPMLLASSQEVKLLVGPSSSIQDVKGLVELNYKRFVTRGVVREGHSSR